MTVQKKHIRRHRGRWAKRYWWCTARAFIVLAFAYELLHVLGEGHASTMAGLGGVIHFVFDVKDTIEC